MSIDRTSGDPGGVDTDATSKVDTAPPPEDTAAPDVQAEPDAPNQPAATTSDRAYSSNAAAAALKARVDPDAPDTQSNAAPAQGTSQASSAGSQPTRLPGGGARIPVPQQDQGSFNSCGTTSLSMILNYFQGPNSANNVAAIDEAIRPNNRGGGPGIDSFTAPADVVGYARDHGMRASLTGDGSFDDLRHMIDQGVPPQILTDYGSPPKGNALHYVVVSGYSTENGVNKFEITNPQGMKESLTEAELNEKWSNLKLETNTPLGQVPTGFNHVIMSMVPESGNVKKPDGTSVPASSIDLPPDNAPVLPNALAQLANRGIGAYNEVRKDLESLKKGAGEVIDKVESVVEDVGSSIEKEFESLRNLLP